jgi:hypothetical protein
VKLSHTTTLVRLEPPKIDRSIPCKLDLSSFQFQNLVVRGRLGRHLQNNDGMCKTSRDTRTVACVEAGEVKASTNR